MFNNRHMTKRIIEELDMAIVQLMWQLIDDMKKTEGLVPDYLQVFELQIEEVMGNRIQYITHSQEVPKYRREIAIISDHAHFGKVFVIDDGGNAVMMFANEY